MSESVEKRVRIEQEEGGKFSFKYMNLSPEEAREACRFAALSLRQYRLFHETPVSLEEYPTDDGSKSVCLLMVENDPGFYISLNGVAHVEATILCDNAAAYIDAMLFPPHSISELEPIYGGLVNAAATDGQ